MERLLTDELKDLAPKFVGGSFVISRLAPQDYHRWHMPVTGMIKSRTMVNGTLYTVNPHAVRQKITIFTENARCIDVVETKAFGTVIIVAVGATMVGSINYPVAKIPNEDLPIRKGDCHGYFAFGGSTVLTLFQPNTIQFDVDLVTNSQKPLETLCGVNSSLGTAIPQTLPPSAAAPESSSNRDISPS